MPIVDNMQMCSQNLKNLLVATLVTSTALLLASMRCPLASDVFSMCQCLDRAVSQSQWFPFSLYTFFFWYTIYSPVTHGSSLAYLCLLSSSSWVWASVSGEEAQDILLASWYDLKLCAQK